MPLFRRIRSDYFDIFVVLDILQETHFLITMKHVTSSSRWSRFIVPLQIQYSWYPRTDGYADTPLSWGARQRSAVHSPSTTADCLVHSANVFLPFPQFPSFRDLISFVAHFGSLVSVLSLFLSLDLIFSVSFIIRIFLLSVSEIPLTFYRLKLNQKLE